MGPLMALEWDLFLENPQTHLSYHARDGLKEVLRAGVGLIKVWIKASQTAKGKEISHEGW